MCVCVCIPLSTTSPPPVSPQLGLVLSGNYAWIHFLPTFALLDDAALAPFFGKASRDAAVLVSGSCVHINIYIDIYIYTYIHIYIY